MEFSTLKISFGAFADTAALIQIGGRNSTGAMPSLLSIGSLAFAGASNSENRFAASCGSKSLPELIHEDGPNVVQDNLNTANASAAGIIDIDGLSVSCTCDDWPCGLPCSLRLQNAQVACLPMSIFMRR